MITILQGEALNIEVDLSPEALGGEVVFHYKRGDAPLMSKTCLKVGNVAKASLSSDETSIMQGDYTFEFRSAMGDVLKSGPMRVISALPHAGTKVISETRQGIIDTCKFTMGYPVVSLFVTNEQISAMIDLAVRKCASKAAPTFTAHLNVTGGVVDVGHLNVDTVRNLYSGGSGSALDFTALTEINVFDPTIAHRAYSDLTKGDWDNPMFDRMAYQYARSEAQEDMMSDFYLDHDKLYVDNYSGPITMEYLKKTLTLEELDNFWTSWVEGYTIALVKITEGRIRTKYKLSSGIFDMEADELINEGTTEKQDLEERVNEYIGYWNIMR